MIVAPSARKHGISDEDAITAARSALAGGPLDDENPQRELRIGLDTAGRLLEIVVLLWDDGEVEIIHAMKARAAYRRLVSSSNPPPHRHPRRLAAPRWSCHRDVRCRREESLEVVEGTDDLGSAGL